MHRFILLLVAVAFAQLTTAAIVQTYCSDENTGSGSDAKYWTWQSNGWCSDQCRSDYAFAVVQGNNCWCSNYVPADQSPVSDCQVDCPGFPSEKCGNADAGLFGYIALDIKASGTQGAASTTKASSSSAPPSSFSSSVEAPETVFRTVTATPSQFVSLIIPSSSAIKSKTVPSSTTTQAPSTISSSTTSWSPTPVTTVQILTVSGAVVTKTITGMSTAPAELTKTKKSNTGVIVGAVIGAVLGLALVGALFFWFFFWRRRSNPSDTENDGKTPQRTTSTMSRTGLLGGGLEKTVRPTLATNNLKRSSTQPLDHSDPASPASDSRRNSRPLFYDQRLNPSALMELDNGSHTSILTIEDNRDYTRTLNVRNPDPPKP